MSNENQSVSIDIASLLTMDKADISELISDKIEAISDGWIDPVDLFIYSKKLEYLTKTLVDAVKDKVDPSIFGKDYVKYGVELSEGMTGVKYDYENCGDLEYIDIAWESKRIEGMLKDRQDFLKSLKHPIEVVNKETSETYTINPPTKTGKLSPIAKIK